HPSPSHLPPLSLHDALPISSRFLYQSLNRCFCGGIISRFTVQSFKGPGPFSIIPSFTNGFAPVEANFVAVLNFPEDFASVPKPFIIKFSEKVPRLSSSIICRRCEIKCSCSGIFTGHTSVHAPHKDDANGNSS